MIVEVHGDHDPEDRADAGHSSVSCPAMIRLVAGSYWMLDWNLRPRAAYPGLLRARRGRCPLRAGRGDRSALADAGRAGQAGLRPGELSGLHGDRVGSPRAAIAG